MTPVTCFAGRRVALFGLGGSGLATAHALVRGGCSVVCWDDGEKGRAKAADEGLVVKDLSTAAWEDFDALILSPGVPLTHPAPHWTVERAKAAGIEVIGDVELFCRERNAIAPGAPFVAITGTNGKSTTTALIAHLMREAGRDVQLGGNIGTAILALAPPAADRVHVIECSSFQIDLAPSLAPTVGVLVNITPDHLDRHGTMENYAAIKERLVAAADRAVIGVDDDHCRAIAERRAGTGGPLLRISVETDLPTGMVREGSALVWTCDGSRREAADLAGIGSLRGVHNAQNAAMAIAAASALGIEEATIRKGLASFPGLAHRMEMVGRIGRALVVNDSKATNADATEKALASFPNGLHWIVGGVAKEGGIAPLAPFFDRIEKAYLIGKSSDAFAATLEGRVPFERSETLERALEAAVAAAQLSPVSEPVLLLSPACASYDQFPNFEVRGDMFRRLATERPDFSRLSED